MVDYVLPSLPVPNEAEWRILDNTSVAGPGPWGATQTLARPGQRWACRIIWNNLSAAERHRMMALLASLRGRANRVWVNDVSATKRGAFASSEICTNPDFANGTTGYVAGPEASLSASNGRMRLTRTKNTNPGGGVYAQAPVGSAVQWAAYAWRSAVAAVRGTHNCGVTLSGSAVVQNPGYDLGASPGYRRLAFSTDAAGAPTVYLDNPGPLTSAAGEYWEASFASLSRCMLADGRPNAATYSDDLTNAAWSKVNFSSVNGNSHTAPDGTLTADGIVEDATNAAHYVQRSITRASGVQDWVCGGYFARITGTRNIRLVMGSDGSNYSICTFDLGTGTAGAVSNVGTATLGRAWIRDAGNGYYACYLASRLVATTTAYVEFDFMNGAAASYAGDGTSRIAFWRCGAAESSFPVEFSGTTSAAVTAASQSGSQIYVKGGRAPGEGALAGALLFGDVVEIIAGTRSHYARLTSDLDLDAAGRGVLQIEPPCPWSISDNAAVIVTKPLVKMMLADGSPAFPTRPGMLSDFSLDLVQDIS